MALFFVRFEVPTVVTVNVMFWDVIPYNMLDSTNVSEKLTASMFGIEECYLEDSGSSFLQNISNYLPVYMALHPRRQSYFSLYTKFTMNISECQNFSS
jgi:hypothetical protein